LGSLTSARFLFFAPRHGRYTLIEHEGPLPLVGGEILLGEPSSTTDAVSKLGRSPLPLDERRCAYLLPLG
jgi:hypothetical protein